MASRTTGADGWEAKSLDQLATLVGGGTPSRSNPEYFGTEIDWVTPSDLRPIGQVDVLGPITEGLSKSGLACSSAKEIAPGSVLFSSRASIGKIAVTDRVCATNQGFTNFVPNRGVIDPWFLAYLLCYHTPAITRLAGKTTYKEVSRSKLRAFKVYLPRLEEQLRVVGRIQECLKRVGEIRRLRHEAIPESEALPAALLESLWNESWPCDLVGNLTTEIRNGWSAAHSPTDGWPEYCVFRAFMGSGSTRKIQGINSLRLTSLMRSRFEPATCFLSEGMARNGLLGERPLSDSDESGVIFQRSANPSSV